MLGGALGPFVVTGDSPLVAKVAIGLLFAVAISMIGVKRQFVPPISTAVAAAGSVAFCAALAILAATSSAAGTGTIVVAALVAAALFWALTR